MIRKRRLVLAHSGANIQPYLQKAERDKQEYEAARKVYEEDAAARARGEDVPDRPPLDANASPLQVPQSLKVEKKELEFTSPEGGFSGFHDPLEGIDLPGLDAIPNHSEQWGDLHHLMGNRPDEKDAQKAGDKEDEGKEAEAEALESKAFESMSAFLADPE